MVVTNCVYAHRHVCTSALQSVAVSVLPVAAMLRRPSMFKRPASGPAMLSEKADEDQQPSNDGIPALLQDAKARRAAYGRMETAIKNIDDKAKAEEVQKKYNAVRTATVNRDKLQKEFLAGWMIDPTWGQSLLMDTFELERLEMS